MFDRLIEQFVAKEWRVIRRAPCSFVLAVVVATGMMSWGISKFIVWHYSDLIALNKGKAEEFDKLFPGQSAEDIDKHILGLEEKISNLEPRTLSDSRKAALSQEADKHCKQKKYVNFAINPANIEAQHYGLILAEPVEQSGCLVNLDLSERESQYIRPDVYGLWVAVPDLGQTPDDRIVLTSMLDAAGLEYNIVEKPREFFDRRHLRPKSPDDWFQSILIVGAKQ